MTKTLTEQWSEGELELNSLWFVRLPCGLYDECFYTGSTIFMKSISGHDEKIWQVLAPVPSYEEYRELLDLNVYEKDRKKVMGLEDKIKRLQEQLEIATKALKEFKKNEDNYLDFGLTSSWKEVKLNPNRVATKALKEMEGIK